MRAALIEWSTHFRALSAGTGRALRACWPDLLFGLALGQIGYHGALLLAAWLSEKHPWIALGVVSLGFSALLVSYLFAFRVLGRHLGVRQHLLDVAADDSGPKESLTHLVAVTLLPFLGIYAVFGKVQETSTALYVYEAIIRGVGTAGVLTQLNPRSADKIVLIAIILLVTYLIRRVLDAAHERTGRRLLGFLTGIVETFFMLVLVFGGTELFAAFGRWWADRRLAGWLNALADAVTGFLRALYSRLPEWIGATIDFITGPVWSTFMSALFSPLLWLAIAALAFGSRITSLSELWRSTIGHRVTVPASVDALAGEKTRKFASEFKELFLGDIDDKYLPTWYSLRLVLASGLGLVGVFCLAHAVVSLIQPGVWQVARLLVGPREAAVWIQLKVGLDLLSTLLMEPIRLALLSVTFVRCLQVLERRAAAVPERRPAVVPDDR